MNFLYKHTVSKGYFQTWIFKTGDIKNQLRIKFVTPNQMLNIH